MAGNHKKTKTSPAVIVTLILSLTVLFLLALVLAVWFIGPRGESAEEHSRAQPDAGTEEGVRFRLFSVRGRTVLSGGAPDA